MEVPPVDLASQAPLEAVLTDAAAALDALLPALDTDDAALARRLTERIRRDLLPRLAAAAPLLLAAIAGPNNVGKSTLFNALAGEALSPAHPEGGLTKQCLAVAHPETASGAGLLALLRRYSVVGVPRVPRRARDAARGPRPPRHAGRGQRGGQ
jgi:hypothetical protein